MYLTIPIYVESRSGAEQQPRLYHVRPLFGHMPRQADVDLERALQKLTQDLRQFLNEVSRGIRHEHLGNWAWNPPLQEHRLDLAIELRARMARGRFFFVTWEALGRKIAFCPSLDFLWFELQRGETLAEWALRVLTDHFRKEEKQAFDESVVRPEDFALDGTAWTTTIEFELKTEQVIPSPNKILKALLGGQDVSDGATELARCGRCLNWQGESERHTVICRDHEIAELERRLTSSERRPVLLLGPSMSGKTAIVQEYVARRMRRREHAGSTRQNVWLLSPQRLIAGMSYVGQWESRLLSILTYARKKDLVLYFDDFLGLFLTGQSRSSALNMATVIKPYLERRDCRFLAEMTPEAWRILRERDRGLADLFDLLTVRAATRGETAQIVMSTRRQLEQRASCRFDISALTTLLDLQERFVADAEFPGKAVHALRELATKYPRGSIGRDQILDSFYARNGITSKFLDPREAITRDDIVSALSAEVIGQKAAVAAVTDVLTTAKARLSDPRRPLGSLLFVGPTGVGKTQLAKAAARYLFGDSQRLIRFDLNQFLQPGSASRLVGTFAEPDGLLTGAIRRSPFAVVLLDEIEKAHPEVFDLLLQVLGEGRLSDALGRTVSFTNTLIIMTSNLGVKETEQQLGFMSAAPVGDHVWIKTIERFFRPEFFNRIDRVVPFQRLSRETVREVALLALEDVLHRDGFSRRQTFVVVEPAALDQLVQEGYSPVWGARGLKRTLERQLVQPLAQSLAAISPQAVTRMHVYPAAAGLTVRLDELQEAVPAPGSLAEGCRWHGLELVECTKRWLEEISARLETDRPRGAVSASHLTLAQQAYFTIQERIRDVERCATQLRECLTSPARGPLIRSSPGVKISKYVSKPARDSQAQTARLREAMAEEQFQSMLDSLNADPLLEESGSVLERRMLRLIALLHAELTAFEEHDADRVALFFWRQLQHGGGNEDEFPTRYHDALGADSAEENLDWGLDVIRHPSAEHGTPFTLELHGLTAAALAKLESGIHLEAVRNEPTRAWNVSGVALSAGQSVQDVWRERSQAREAWLEQLKRGDSSATDDPWKPLEVVRLFEASGAVLDFRTSSIHPGGNVTQFLRTSMLDAWPLPEAFRIPLAAGEPSCPP